MKITTVQDFSNVSTLEDLTKYSSQAVDAILKVINGNVDLVANTNCALLPVGFAKPNTTYAFNHGLQRVPQGYISAGLSQNMILFNGSSKNTSTQVFIQSSAGGSGMVLVF